MAALDPSEPFTTAQARAAGITRGRLRGPRFQTLFNGVFVSADTSVTTEVKASAALLIHPRTALLSHTTAARLLDVPVPDDPDIHVSVPDAAHRRRRPGIRSHVSAHGATWEVNGLRTSGASDLFCEVAGILGLADLVVAGDAIARRHSASALRQQIAEHRCHAGPAARQAAGLVCDRVESPMETRVRLLLIFAGFPLPEVNRQIRHRWGHYRPDLSWPDLRLAVEYDGQHHRSDLGQWDRDIRRREWFQAQGWRVITLVARDVYRRPEESIRRIYTAWRECGGPPITLKSQWRRHFPSHR